MPFRLSMTLLRVNHGYHSMAYKRNNTRLVSNLIVYLKHESSKTNGSVRASRNTGYND